MQLTVLCFSHEWFWFEILNSCENGVMAFTDIQLVGVVCIYSAK